MSDISKTSILGTCLQMCSESERELRIKNRMVHCLEQPPYPNGMNECILVKSFSRSAAGNTRSCDPKEIRPPYICRRTTNYLIENILFRNEEGNSTAYLNMDLTTYHFVFDRLRALRQDMAVQNIGILEESEDNINDLVIHCHILQACIKFHLLANYMFGHRNNTASVAGNERRSIDSRSSIEFDSHLNFSHLLECLKMILTHYEILYPRKCHRSVCDAMSEMHIDNKSLNRNNTRFDMIGVYLLLNIGSYHSYRWELNLDDEVKNNNVVASALKMNKLYLERNYVGLFKQLRKLSLIHMLAFHWNLPFIFKEILAVMNVAYSSKVCKFPLSHFAKLFALEKINEDELMNCCQEYHIQTYSTPSNIQQTQEKSPTNIKDNYICFNKSNFNATSTLKWQKLPCIDDQLKLQNLQFFLLDYNLR